MVITLPVILVSILPERMVSYLDVDMINPSVNVAHIVLLGAFIHPVRDFTKFSADFQHWCK